MTKSKKQNSGSVPSSTIFRFISIKSPLIGSRS
ncbi:Protein of unknown function [Pyronema omphalodes CBS 100304]|uniref:Uncharacterized protein n=1 Tax=Pyronema omphalodes (strain CBS 100304) TaxID=1076935 RepID=U4KYU3_PYROM|nr:Protein of unknown function [Pyronema omphalodes CBS 100304]